MTNTTQETQEKVKELNKIFQVNLKSWNESINFYMDRDDSDYFDAVHDAMTDDKLKKSFIFISFRTAKKIDCIKCLGNSYSIKDELKELGFEYNKAPQSGWNLIA